MTPDPDGAPSSTKPAELFAEPAKALEALGPGLITGAADDDPSGIATYSQAGAQFGTSLLWTTLICLPMMIAIQSVCAQIGLATGKGLAASIKRVFPRSVLMALVALLALANTLNAAADVAAMGETFALLTPGLDRRWLAVAFGLLSLVLQLFVPYQRYARYLKWLTASLFAYVAVVFTVKAPWGEALRDTVWPRLSLDRDWLTTVVALFGTTISPYLFFWQASEEVEEIHSDSAVEQLTDAPEQARGQLQRMGFDTVIGMTFSQLAAFFIILTTAATLHVHGVTDVRTAAEAAQALRPLAGDFTFLLFTVGIMGVGLLGVPVLVGSTAYALAETFGWRQGLNHSVREARAFYGVITASMIFAMGFGFLPIDPFKALFWSAVINGVVAVPLMAVAMVVASRKDLMAGYIAGPMQRFWGWAATAVMGVAAAAMIATSF
jgi:NRAMP (natural resistance-associated macrophage protein)-like metal ion transporter